MPKPAEGKRCASRRRLGALARLTSFAFVPRHLCVRDATAKLADAVEELVDALRRALADVGGLVRPPFELLHLFDGVLERFRRVLELGNLRAPLRQLGDRDALAGLVDLRLGKDDGLELRGVVLVLGRVDDHAEGGVALEPGHFLAERAARFALAAEELVDPPQGARPDRQPAGSAGEHAPRRDEPPQHHVDDDGLGRRAARSSEISELSRTPKMKAPSALPGHVARALHSSSALTCCPVLAIRHYQN